MQKTAIVCVTNDLTTDQRVHKTCLTLQKCGYNIIETGRLLKNSLPLNRPYLTRRPTLFFSKGPFFYAEYNLRLFLYLLFSKVDLIFSNDLDTLPAAYLASKFRKKKLIYDTHEYFTETPELQNRPQTKAIWKTLEKLIFPHLTAIITVNESIARLYSEEYHKDVAVCRNIPLTHTPEHLKSRKELGLPENKHILILQGAGINVQRGAEEALLAMKFIENAVLLIVGGGDVIPVLIKMVDENKLEDKVIFKPKMAFAELRQYTMNSDLGLALDKDTNLNYHFSLPNKLFDYIHSGIPVLSSELVELKQIIDHYNIGYFIQKHEPEHIAEVINRIFSDPKRLEVLTQNTRKATSELCWENEEKVLISIIQKANT